MLDCLDAHERRYAQGERIHHMGDSVSTAGIVLTGRVRIEHVDPWGNVSVVGMRGPGAMFGEAYAAAGDPASPVVPSPPPPPGSRCSWTSSPTRTAPSSS